MNLLGRKEWAWNMADEVIQLEARLKNFISGEVNKIQNDLKGMGTTFETQMAKGKKATSAFGSTFKQFVSVFH